MENISIEYKKEDYSFKSWSKAAIQNLLIELKKANPRHDRAILLSGQ